MGRHAQGQLELFGEPDPVPPTKAPPQPVAPAAVRFEHLAEIAVEGPLRGSFTYVADAVWAQLRPGVRVLVPFGPRALPGFFLGERSAEDLAREGINPARLKSILRVFDSPGGEALISERLLRLARWMARHYAAPLGSTLAAMLPAGVKKGAAAARVRLVGAAVPLAQLLEQAELLAATKPKQAALLLSLATNLQSGGDNAEAEPLSAASLLSEAEAPDSALKALAKAGLIKLSETRIDSGRDRFSHTEAHSHDLALTPEQQAALKEIEADLIPGPFPAREGVNGEAPLRGFLLQGVTGSGKTEVYLRALKTALAQGKQGIVLVPEIALTPQTAQRFEKRLGRERVTVLHSHMTEGERAEAWHAIRAGQIDAVVGARSALFAPLPRLGLIIIDEEHENAFKQESTPRYHARDVAMELARLSGAVLVLGSATPSFETLHAAKRGVLKHLLLTQRVAGRPMPPVELVDLALENRETKRYTYLSRQLLAALGQTISRGEQAILFMNRRGFATVITCLRCGFTEKCAQCDIALTSHRGQHSDPHDHSGGLLTCHYCNFAKPIPELCGNCGAPGVKHWGLGTERVESEVKKAFPGARVARMDSDTMTHRTAYLEALGNFRAGKTDVLIGTQMIAKGLDFPNVTLVGVVLADTALHMPDFRSRERTFQLLAQVAGRAGRGDKGGRVIIQTQLPNDPAVKAAVRHDYETFALNELQERRAFGYPPFTRLARVVIRGKDAKETRDAAESVAAALRAQANPGPGTQGPGPGGGDPGSRTPATILGPAEPPLAKLEGYYRQHIVIKAESSELIAALFAGPAAEVIAKLRKADAMVDIDALSML